MARRKKLPEIFVDCSACKRTITIDDILKLGTGHVDNCAARPTLLRVDSDSEGRWVPIIQSPQCLAPQDKERIRAEVKEMIADFNRRG